MVPPAALYMMDALSVTVVVVMVGLPVNVIFPVADHAVPLVNVNAAPLTASVDDPEKVDVQPFSQISCEQFDAFAIVTVTPVKYSKYTKSPVPGTENPLVAATMSCVAYVPPTLTTHALPLPLTMVPRLVPPARRRTVMPATSAGEPVVVRTVPLHDAEISKGIVAAHTVVPAVVHEPVPPIQ